MVHKSVLASLTILGLIKVGNFMNYLKLKDEIEEKGSSDVFEHEKVLLGIVF